MSGTLPVADPSCLVREDLLAVLTVLTKVAECQHLESLRQVAINETAALIQSTSVSWTEVNIETRLSYGAINSDVDPGRISQEMARVAHQHPVINYFQRTGDGTPHAISDFLPRRKFQGLDLYQNLYRRYETEDQLSISHLHGREWVVGLVVNRNEWGFAGRDRALLEAMRPTFFSVFDRLKALNDLSLAAEGVPGETAHVSLLRKSLVGRGLSKREAEVLAWIVDGKTNSEIAGLLKINEGTVRKHVERVFFALGVRSRAAATRVALERLREVDSVD